MERLTRLTLISKVGRSSDEKVKSLTDRLVKIPPMARLTLTADNGGENTNHQQITLNLGLDVYFCHAYHSWEKGTVENTNGRIRRFIPKGKSIDDVTEEQVKEVERRLNSTPRKCLGYLTPYEKMDEVLT